MVYVIRLCLEMAEYPAMKYKRLYTKCDCFSKEDVGTFHIHSVFGMVRQILYHSSIGGWYIVPVWISDDIFGAGSDREIRFALWPYRILERI